MLKPYAKTVVWGGGKLTKLSSTSPATIHEGSWCPTSLGLAGNKPFGGHTKPLSSMTLATLGIISIGDMGLGIARLAIANNYQVITNASDRR